jgi:hypothetical protein
MKEHTGIEETIIFFKEDHNSLSNVTGSNSVRFSEREREREYHDFLCQLLSNFIVDYKLVSSFRDLLLEYLNSNTIEKADTLNHNYANTKSQQKHVPFLCN